MSRLPAQARTDTNLASLLDGWQATALVSASYVYFLIFAQFGFLKRLDKLALTEGHLKAVMAFMAFGGILASLASPRWHIPPGRKIRVALAGCAAAAALSASPLNFFSAASLAAGIGLSLGLLTVTLVTHLGLWAGSHAPLWKVGLGTGIGYAICNIPTLFNASPRAIAWSAAGICVAAVFVPRSTGEYQTAAVVPDRTSTPFLLVLACFTALVWFDSAAFFIIQASPLLKAGTWAGEVHLWRNAALHLTAALLSVALLRRRGLLFTLVCAYACLAGACILLHNPETVPGAAWFYPVGVSLYSVALVAAPSYLLRANSARERGAKAGLLYAVSGWGGSALGIGMAQNLHRVPTAFIVAAGVLILCAFLLQIPRSTALSVLAIGAVFGMSGILYRVLPRSATVSSRDEVAYGRQVYIAEGCIHCHSQYVRPNSHDVLIWGPAQDVEAVRHQKPPLIGNRRQGPDLSEVGSRRSALWLRIHFDQPDAVSYDSVMPSYRYLFNDSRGNALIAYLRTLATQGVSQHELHEITEWSPSPENGTRSATGAVLFQRYCATCHSETGTVRQRWRNSFAVIPPDLSKVNLQELPTSLLQEPSDHRLNRIIKFGIPGTDMPGHEYLDDADVEELSRYVAQISSQWMHSAR